MLFGFGGRPKTEAVGLDMLDSLLSSLFDSKLKALEARGSRTVKELSSARGRFGEACQKFEGVADEPQLEYFFIDNVNFIKGQKLAYTKALRRIMAEWEIPDSGASTIYERYSAIASGAGRFIGEVLGANTNFKKVLQAYPGRLDLFKGSFSLIERLTESLRNELGRAAPALAEYRNINNQLSRLHSLKDEADAMRREMLQMGEAAHHGTESAESSEEQGILVGISGKRGELSEVNRESSLLHQRIARLTGALERPSKKFDHVVQRKRGLNQFIRDPIGSLNSGSDYGDFRALIDEMAKQVESGGIEAKNTVRIREAVAELIDADIYGMVEGYKRLGQRASSLQGEIKSLEDRLARLGDERKSSQRASESKESVGRRAAETAARMDGVKGEIERLFLEYYGRRISITVEQ